MRRVLAALVAGALVASAAACRRGTVTYVTIATGGTGGVYYPLGGALAQLYTTQLPGIVASAQATVASVFNVQAVDLGRADVAFTQGDVAYLAWSEGTTSRPAPHTHLRGLAVLYVNTVQVVVRADSRIRGIRDLRGRRVGVGAPGSGTEVAARILIEAHGLSYDDVKVDYLSFAEVAAQMQDRTLDAGFLVASFPVAALTDIATTLGVRLLPVEADAAARIAAGYPFYRPVVIPKGTYRGLDEDLQTVGVDNLLVTHDRLSDDLVYGLTRVLVDSVPELARTHAAAKKITAERIARTPLPLHPGAARFYRDRGMLE